MIGGIRARTSLICESVRVTQPEKARIARVKLSHFTALPRPQLDEKECGIHLLLHRFQTLPKTLIWHRVHNRCLRSHAYRRNLRDIPFPHKAPDQEAWRR